MTHPATPNLPYPETSIAEPSVAEPTGFGPGDARVHVEDIVDLARSYGCKCRHANRVRRRDPAAMSFEDDGFD